MQSRSQIPDISSSQEFIHAYLKTKLKSKCSAGYQNSGITRQKKDREQKSIESDCVEFSSLTLSVLNSLFLRPKVRDNGQAISVAEGAL